MSNKEYCIYTGDMKNGIHVGQIVVNNSAELKEFCNGLLKNVEEFENFREIKSEPLGGFESLIPTRPIRVDEKIIYYDIIRRYGHDECEYIKREIEYLKLNSILLFNSFLGELDSTYYDVYAQDFVAKGIINYKPFNQIWEQCSSNMVNQIVDEYKRKNVEGINSKLKKARFRLRKLDLLAFRFALKNGMISYQTDDKLNHVQARLVNGMQIETNNIILLDDEVSKEILKKRCKRI